MINENTLVIYKSKPAIVKKKADGKFTIVPHVGDQIKVRDKDIEMIHSGPVKDVHELAKILSDADAALVAAKAQIREAWELLTGEGAPLSLKDLAAFIFGEYTAVCAYAAYLILQDGLYFSAANSGITDAIMPRSREEVETEEARRNEKQREADERAHFMERIKACLKKTASFSLLPSGARFFQDIEALAYGKTAKSRTMKELGLSETPEEAHALLLKTGFWQPAVNPHPVRFGITLASAKIRPDDPPAEDRRDLCHLASFAIDSPWSDDPDDAVSIETDEASGRSVLYVHVADPASSVMPNSAVEKEARNRGVTLYLSEGIIRMICEESLPMFALGLSEKSLALTFKLTLDDNASIIDTEIFPSIVKVRRITYEEADRLLDSAGTAEATALCAMYELAMRYLKRRTAQGAVNIELPDVNISVENGNPDIQPAVNYYSASLVKECMIMAGEGAGNWASGKGLAFPYISQEVEIQGEVSSGMAGSYQLRRCMRPRILSTKPGRHQGLGLDTYTQVTSPLRRYTDLLAHMQIRAFLRKEKPLGADEVSAHLGFSEAASSAAVQAERASVSHWTMVYLSDKKDTVWDAVVLEKKGNRFAVVIPSLALETQIPLQNDVSPNETVRVVLKSVNIPKCEAVFVQE